MFKMLEAQTYKNFKVFITGDNYQPENEFIEVCNEYTGEIYLHNNNINNNIYTLTQNLIDLKTSLNIFSASASCD